AKNEARNNFLNPIRAEQKALLLLLNEVAKQSNNQEAILKINQILATIKDPERKNLISAARKITRLISNEEFAAKKTLQNWIIAYKTQYQHVYSAHFQNDFENKATNVKEIKPIYADDMATETAYIVLKSNFDAILAKHDDVFIFGEDSGNIGDVNQGLVGLQEKYSELRVTDTGIRETTIIGQGIGMAMRGLRPIAEIQYLDYALYALQVMSDDLATLRYRSGGRQKAPLIVRTRGHRLEGIWHSGSPMGGMIHLLRGMHILVPRNMTKAAGFYNTLLESDEPAMVVENLNGYRLKEKMPLNLGEFRTPIGVVETIKEGKDITVVSYGSTLRIVEQAVEELAAVGIEVELIDIQSLLPFDIHHDIAKSIQKTNRLLVVDEDVPGGASAFILQQIIEVQNGYQYLDSKPSTLTAQPHRAAYGDDGDYFSKPNLEDIFEKVYEMMSEVKPIQFKKLY
ncbi:MAG: transketolase C-terminal domain-containing protein, partial [Flavobacteriaceae bacterium]|nr:transketolase C-terminal domain-containing protein [Flavobacteriaceae bacterium]